MIRPLAVRLAVLAMLSGCAPIDGYPCETEGATQCDGAAVAYCERTNLGGLKWKAYDCPSGCDPLKAALKCDWRGVAPGAACPVGRAAPVYCAGDQLADLCAGSGTWSQLSCGACRAGAKVSETLNCTSGVCRCD